MKTDYLIKYIKKNCIQLKFLLFSIFITCNINNETCSVYVSIFFMSFDAEVAALVDDLTALLSNIATDMSVFADNCVLKGFVPPHPGDLIRANKPQNQQNEIKNLPSKIEENSQQEEFSPLSQIQQLESIFQTKKEEKEQKPINQLDFLSQTIQQLAQPTKLSSENKNHIHKNEFTPPKSIKTTIKNEENTILSNIKHEQPKKEESNQDSNNISESEESKSTDIDFDLESESDNDKEESNNIKTEIEIPHIKQEIKQENSALQNLISESNKTGGTTSSNDDESDPHAIVIDLSETEAESEKSEENQIQNIVLKKEIKQENQQTQQPTTENVSKEEKPNKTDPNDLDVEPKTENSIQIELNDGELNINDEDSNTNNENDIQDVHIHPIRIRLPHISLDYQKDNNETFFFNNIAYPKYLEYLIIIESMKSDNPLSPKNIKNIIAKYPNIEKPQLVNLIKYLIQQKLV